MESVIAQNQDQVVLRGRCRNGEGDSIFGVNRVPKIMCTPFNSNLSEQRDHVDAQANAVILFDWNSQAIGLGETDASSMNDSQPDLNKIVEETDDLFRPTGIEAEEVTETAASRPYDPEQIRVDPKMFSLRQVLDMIDDGDLELEPDFQRLRSWTLVQRSRLVESVLLRIPLPAFYFSSDLNGKLQVVDGMQRLSTLYDFVRGGRGRDSFFRLDSLEYLQLEVGKKFIHDIELPLWIRRIHTTQLIVNVIDPQTPYRVKFDIFKRINTGGTPLNAQEIRHCLSSAQSREFLAKLAELPAFHDATGGVLWHNKRMVDREVILRFCAFGWFPRFENYHRYESMDEFLNKAYQFLDEIDDSEMSDIQLNFETAMRNAMHIFGKHAFRKWPQVPGDKVGPFNRALFDVWSVLLAQYDELHIITHAETLRETARDQMTWNDAFTAAISSGTGALAKVLTRFNVVTNILSQATSHDKIDPT